MHSVALGAAPSSKCSRGVPAHLTAGNFNPLFSLLDDGPHSAQEDEEFHIVGTEPVALLRNKQVLVVR